MKPDHVDPIVIHVLRTTRSAGARYRLTEHAQTWRRTQEAHCLAWALINLRFRAAGRKSL